MTHPQLKLTNTLTREKDVFTPLDPQNVGLYVCGVTPYDNSHIGHARAYVVFDVLYRLLRHVYGENHVTYVRNFTDIDDKIIQRAAELGQTPTEVAEKNIKSFYQDMDALNILRPNVEPRVSTHMPQIVKMVDELVEKGYAYVTPSGDVMYRTQKFPRFGELARRKLDEQQHGSRVAEDAEKESPNDFVLWKANAKSATKMEQAFSPAELGATRFSAEGRPGWHIECSVMSREHLGPTFDIHGGGEDLQFPHHCCEIAQSEALLPAGQQMARYWLHNGFITVNGTKMSKSLGNFTTIKKARKEHSPGAIRLWLLQTHYRKPVDYSDEALNAAENRLFELKELFDRIHPEEWDIHWSSRKEIRERRDYEDMMTGLLDDLNTSQMLSLLSELNHDLRRALDNKDIRRTDKFMLTLAKWYDVIDILGLNPKPQRRKSFFNKGHVYVTDATVRKKIYQRMVHIGREEWFEADKIRDELKAKGIQLKDTPSGNVTWRRT